MTLRKAALFASILVVQFVLIEVALRVRGGSEASPVFQSLFMRDERVGHRLKPGAAIHYVTSEFATDIRVNQAGVRDDAELGAKAPGERRIVVLGDSLVLSVQVQLAQTFCKRLEARLSAADPAHRYRVVNAGVQGYGPVEEWLFFSHVVSALEPDLVLVSVFVGNDAIEAFDAAPQLESSTGAGDRAKDRTTRWARRMVRQSMVLQTVRLRVDTVRARLRPAPVPQRPLATYLADPPPEVARGLEVTKRCLALIADRAAAVGARTALLLMPARFQLEDEDFARLAEAVGQGGGTLVRDAATDRFARALVPLGLPTLDLLPVLRQQPDPATLFFRENVHLTPRGHDVVAAALDGFIRDRDLLAPPPRAGAAGIVAAR